MVGTPVQFVYSNVICAVAVGVRSDFSAEMDFKMHVWVPRIIVETWVVASAWRLVGVDIHFM
jgi:hypothetical protein